MHTKDKLFVSLSDDLLFKETFGHPNNRKYLIYFLASITDFSIDYLNTVKMQIKYESILSKTKLNDKIMRGDIIITFKHYIINLECYSKFNEAAFNKSASYIMRIFSTQMDSGYNNYERLENIIQINIVDNVALSFPEELQFSYGLVNLKDGKDVRLKDKFSIKCFRLDKARELKYNENDKALLWLKFIGAKSQEERNKIAEGDELIMELNDWIDKYINNEHTKEVYGKWAEKIAEQNGREEGENNKTLEIAKNLIKLNTPLEKIHLATGLPIKAIKKLQS